MKTLVTSRCLFLFFFFCLLSQSFVLSQFCLGHSRECFVSEEDFGRQSLNSATSLFTYAVCSWKCNAYCLVSYVLLFTSGRKFVFSWPCACLHRKLLVACFEKKCTPRLCVNHGLARFIGTCGRRETQAEREVLLSGGALELQSEVPWLRHLVRNTRFSSDVPLAASQLSPNGHVSNCPRTKEDGCVSGKLSAFFFLLWKGKKKLFSSDWN